MNHPGLPVDPVPFSLGWIRNRLRRWWKDARTHAKVLFFVGVVLVIIFIIRFPLRYFVGVGNYLYGYFQAFTLGATLQESCASFEDMEGWQLWDLNYSDYLRSSRCLGNDDGFTRQGQPFSLVWDLILYIVTFGGYPSLVSLPLVRSST